MGSQAVRSIRGTDSVRADLLVGIYRWDCVAEGRHYLVVRSSTIATVTGLETSKRILRTFSTVM